ncbi:MAG TPA: hypothetical protein VGW78_06040 [Candidatus Babeliales bacterium]|nr:hypothetical protein [Candidatus Babeliales bacterium]
MMHISKNYIQYFFIISSCSFCVLYGGDITIVYNLRIAETTRHQAHAFKKGQASIITATGFNQFRKRENDSRQFAGGLLGTYIYSLESFYVRVATAVGHVSSDGPRDCFAATQMDDVLFSAGYGFSFDDTLRMTISAHVGIPTHSDTSLADMQFGTGHASLGGQIDGLWHYTKNSALLAAVRFIHFFPRTVPVDDLPHCFRFTLGNVIDLFFSYQTQWAKRHQIEIGYNPTCICNATIHPTICSITNQINILTQSFFGTYRYGFLLNTMPSAIIIGISYGFDHRPAQLSDQYIVTPWISWGILF